MSAGQDARLYSRRDARYTANHQSRKRKNCAYPFVFFCKSGCPFARISHQRSAHSSIFALLKRLLLGSKSRFHG
jgi:sulfatase maturation enzyme AslB (radical SAM superfamily)